MDSSTDIANQALLHLGSYSEIQNLDTDTSKEARVMRRVYNNLLRSLLSVWQWPFATVFAQGQLVSYYPTPEWYFAYQYPNQCLRVTRIWNARHVDDVDSKIEFIQGNDTNQKLIYTNFGPSNLLPSNIYVPTPYSSTQASMIVQGTLAIFEYTALCTNCALMPQLFKEALAFFMAAYGAPALPGIGQTDLMEKNLQLGNAMLERAGAQNLNEMFIAPNKRSMIEKAATGAGLLIPFNPNWNPVPANWTP